MKRKPDSLLGLKRFRLGWGKVSTISPFPTRDRVFRQLGKTISVMGGERKVKFLQSVILSCTAERNEKNLTVRMSEGSTKARAW